MTGIRALVQRPRRKMHLAAFDAELRCWVTFCDLYVAADEQTAVHRWSGDWSRGVTRRLVDELRRVTRQAAKPGVCAHCTRLLMLMQLLQHDRAHGHGHEYGVAA